MPAPVQFIGQKPPSAMHFLGQGVAQGQQQALQQQMLQQVFSGGDDQALQSQLQQLFTQPIDPNTRGQVLQGLQMQQQQAQRQQQGGLSQKQQLDFQLKMQDRATKSAKERSTQVKDTYDAIIERVIAPSKGQLGEFKLQSPLERKRLNLQVLELEKLKKQEMKKIAKDATADLLIDNPTELLNKVEGQFGAVGVNAATQEPVTGFQQQGGFLGFGGEQVARKLDPANPEDQKIAQDILVEAGGDAAKAREIAKERGFGF